MKTGNPTKEKEVDEPKKLFKIPPQRELTVKYIG